MSWTEGWAKQRIINIFAEITNDCARDTISQIWGYAAVSNEPIVILLNTPGGDVFHSMAIVRAIEACPVPVHTLAIGRVYSGGIIILVAGHKRGAFPKTLFMAHEFHNMKETGVGYKSLKRARKLDDWTYENLVSHFHLYTKLSIPQITQKLLSTEYYFDENEALKMGIVDGVIRDKMKLSV